MSEYFTFTQSERQNNNYPSIGNIKLGFIELDVCPTDLALSYSIDGLLECLDKIIKGQEASYIFSDTDDTTSISVENDIFKFTWGSAYDLVSSSSIKCPYTKNKTEINKFVLYLYDEYKRINNNGDDD